MPTRRAVLEGLVGAAAGRLATTSEPEPLRIAIWATERAVDGGAWCELAELVLEVRRALQEAVDDRVVVELRGSVDISSAPTSTAQEFWEWWGVEAPPVGADDRHLLVPESVGEHWSYDGVGTDAASGTPYESFGMSRVLDGLRSRSTLWLALHEIGHGLGLTHQHGTSLEDGRVTPMVERRSNEMDLQYSDAAKRELRRYVAREE